MEGRGAFVRVGLLLVVGIGAIIGVVVFLNGSRVTEGAHYETYFRESVQGLEVGAPVKYRGVTLGQVNQIGLVSAAYMRDEPADVRRVTSRLVFVRFVIDPARVGRVPDPATAVAAGLRTRLASQGLTGLAYLELDFADITRFPPQDVPWKPQYPYLPSMPSTISQVQDAAQALLAKINAVDIVGLGTAVQAVMGDLHGQLSEGDAAHALKEANGLLTSLHTAVDRADLPGLATELRGTATAVRGVAQGRETKELLASAARTAERFGDAATKLPALIAALNATLQRANAGAADLQADLAPVLRDARTAATNLRETTETLRRYPASVLFGAAPPRPEERR